MFCTSCGTAITPEQIVCSKCGSPTSIGIMRGAFRKRVAEHYQLLGILHIVYSSFVAIGGLALIFVSKHIFAFILQFAQHNPGPPAFVGPLLELVGWVLVIRAAAGIAGGIGLLQRAHWGRVLTLVVGFTSILSLPFGTALGVYTIWVLLSGGAEAEYNQLVAAPH